MSLALVFLYGSRFYRYKQPLAYKSIQNNQNYGKKIAQNSGHWILPKNEELKMVLRLIPMWVSSVMYGLVLAQATFFVKQSSTMDRKIGPYFEIPPAALWSTVVICIIVLVPVYDRFFVPIARSFTRIERGITLLQRIGIGIFLSVACMAAAVVTEIKRLKTAKDYGLEDMPHATIPLTICWVLPQYILYGSADVFAVTGLQEYFYHQMPETI
eukprot:Gb_01315 [translate_table: standard]